MSLPNEIDVSRSTQNAFTEAAFEAGVRAAKAGDYEGFYLWVGHPTKEFLDQALEIALPSCSMARFVLREQDFVYRHLESMIKSVEGPDGSSQKTHFVMSKLLEFLITGREIFFPRNKDNPAVPAKIFKSHDEIVEYLKGIHMLFYGDLSGYLGSLGKLMATEESS